MSELLPSCESDLALIELGVANEFRASGWLPADDISSQNPVRAAAIFNQQNVENTVINLDISPGLLSF